MHRMSARLQSIGRSLSERSALSPRSNEDSSYGSFLLTLGGLTQSLRRSTSYQVIINDANDNITKGMFIKDVSVFFFFF